MLVSRVREWWWRRGYRRFYTIAPERFNVYAMNAGYAERFKELVKELRHLVQPEQNDVVLDLGGGNGLLSSEVFAECKRIVVLDFSVYSRQLPQERFSRTVFVVGDAARPPFREGSFTKVFSYSLLPTLGSERVVRQMVRNWDPLLIHGGALYIGDIPARRKFPAILLGGLRRAATVQGFKYCVAVVLISYFSMTGLKNLLSGMGYTVTRITQSKERRFHTERFDLFARKADG